MNRIEKTLVSVQITAKEKCVPIGDESLYNVLKNTHTHTRTHVSIIVLYVYPLRSFVSNTLTRGQVNIIIILRVPLHLIYMFPTRTETEKYLS